MEKKNGIRKRYCVCRILICDKIYRHMLDLKVKMINIQPKEHHEILENCQIL